MGLADRTRSLWVRFRTAGGSSAALYALTTFLSRAVTIVLAPLYTRQLSLAEYGDLGLAQTLVATLPTFVSLGMLAALSRFFYEGTSKTESIQKVGAVARWILLFGAGGAVSLQALVLLVPLQEQGVFKAYELSCVIWGATGTLFLGIPLGVLRASQRAVAASVVQLVDFVVSLGSALVLVAGLHRGIRGALEAVAIAGVVNAVLATVFVVRSLPARLDRRLLKQALNFSLPYVPHFVANQLLLISDRWLLKLFGFDAELGVYSLASQLAAPVSMVILAWNEAVTPKLGEIVRVSGVGGLKSELRSIVWSYLRLAIVVGALIVLGGPLIRFAFGDAFGRALWLLPFVCLALSVEAFYYPYSNVLFFANETAVIPRTTILAGVLNVASNAALVPFFGVPGAVASRILAGSARSLTIALIARKRLDEDGSTRTH